MRFQVVPANLEGFLAKQRPQAKLTHQHTHDRATSGAQKIFMHHFSSFQCLMLQQSQKQVKQNKCANRWYTGIPWNTTHWWRLPSVFKEHHSNFRKISWFSRSILWSLRPLPCLPGYQHYLQASSSSKTQQVLESVNHCRWQETLQKLQWWTLYVSSIVYLQQHTSRPTFPESRTLHRNSTYQTLCHVLSTFVPSNR